MPAQASVTATRRRTPATVTRHRTDIQEAVDRVYRRYGDDLSAFYRDVKKSILTDEAQNEGGREKSSDRS
jgi:hypothetical protein